MTMSVAYYVMVSAHFFCLSNSFLYTERLSACSSNNNNNNNNEEEDSKADVRSGEVSTYSRPGQLIIKLRINNRCWQCCLVGIVHTISYCRH